MEGGIRVSHFALTVRFPGGGPLIGGAASIPRGFHASHAQLPDGKPYIPASALRGALRESFEAVLRGTGEHSACSGGDGMDPEICNGSPEDVPSGLCTLGPGGTPCLACRLFGTRRSSIGAAERAFSGLVLGDALPVGTPGWTTRPSVAVGRASRSAKDKHLLFQRIPAAPGDEPLTFTALGRVRDPSLAAYLEAATRATTHIGAGRSRGLARVELALAWREPPAPANYTSPASATEHDLLVRVTLTSPALIGASIIDANYRETRHEIPGSTVRGAVGFALREMLADADGDRDTQDLLDAEHGAQFGFLYSADATPPPGSGTIPGPLPITAAVCKREGRAHGVVDTLLDRLVLLHATSAKDAERAIRPATTRCARCPAPLRTAHGSRRAAKAPDTRTIVRASMDRTRQAARDGQLFSQVLLAPGVILEGTIRNIPARSRQRLTQALGSGIVSFGRGRSSGWGQARLDHERAPAIRPLSDRAVAFDRALRTRLDEAGLSSERIGRLVPVTLLSPLWPLSLTGGSDGDLADGERDLREAVGNATCFLAARRFVREGAWDQRTGTMTTFQATAAGGVFVLELRQATWRDLVDRLESLERHGIGRRRDQGYGQVLCFDPHFLISPQNG